MVDCAIRRRIGVLCRDKGRRFNGRNLNVPNKWSPQTVRQPESGLRFTEEGAWEFIADCLENIQDVTVKHIGELKHPKIPAYYMLVAGEVDERRIYMKVGYVEKTNSVIGVSFHYSDEEYQE